MLIKERGIYILPDNIDYRKLIKKVYELSAPLGMGHFCTIEGCLPEKTVDKIMAGASHDFDLSYKDNFDGEGAPKISMDYIHGRCCKFCTFKDYETGKYAINYDWRDHNKSDTKKLIKAIESGELNK